MDWPFEAITLGRPWPREDLLEVQPAAAEVVREDEVLPCLVVLYSVFGLVEKTQGGVVCVYVCQWDRVGGVVSSFCNWRTILYWQMILGLMCISYECKFLNLKSFDNEMLKMLLIESILTLIIKYHHKTNPLKIKQASWPFPRSRTRSRSYFEGWLSSEKVDYLIIIIVS